MQTTPTVKCPECMGEGTTTVVESWPDGDLERYPMCAHCDGKAHALASPVSAGIAGDELLKFTTELYGYLESTCSEGFADEAFRVAPEAVTAAIAAVEVGAGNVARIGLGHTQEAGRLAVTTRAAVPAQLTHLQQVADEPLAYPDEPDWTAQPQQVEGAAPTHQAESIPPFAEPAGQRDAGRSAWEYRFIHSSATGRGDSTVGPCLTYDKAIAYGVGCINQRIVFVSMTCGACDGTGKYSTAPDSGTCEECDGTGKINLTTEEFQ